MALIRVEELKYVYPNTGHEAIKAIDFHIDQGEIFGFLGPSGAGKTTTQRVLIGLLKGYSGSVDILGKERRQWKRDFYEHIGVAFDFPNMYVKLTALENLKLISGYYSGSKNDPLKLLDRVGLLPHKDQKVESFSKGMKMRLNFIHSLLHNPRLLFLDEPTSGLDPVNAKIIKDMILELKGEGKTIFLTTHNMAVAEQLCDRVAFIVDGKIAVSDRPDQLKIRYGQRVVKVTCWNGSELQTAEFPMDRIGENPEFLSLIKSDNVRSIHSLDASLEEIFIRLTGRELQ